MSYAKSHRINYIKNEVDIIKCKLSPNVSFTQQKLYQSVSRLKAQFQCKFGNYKNTQECKLQPKALSNMAKVVAQR